MIMKDIKMKYRKQKIIKNNFKSCQILTKLEFNTKEIKFANNDYLFAFK